MDQTPERNSKDEHFLRGFVISSGTVISAVAIYILVNMIILMGS